MRPNLLFCQIICVLLEFGIFIRHPNKHVFLIDLSRFPSGSLRVRRARSQLASRVTRAIVAGSTYTCYGFKVKYRALIFWHDTQIRDFSQSTTKRANKHITLLSDGTSKVKLLRHYYLGGQKELYRGNDKDSEQCSYMMTTSATAVTPLVEINLNSSGSDSNGILYFQYDFSKYDGQKTAFKKSQRNQP